MIKFDKDLKNLANWYWHFYKNTNKQNGLRLSSLRPFFVASTYASLPWRCTNRKIFLAWCILETFYPFPRFLAARKLGMFPSREARHLQV